MFEYCESGFPACDLIWVPGIHTIPETKMKNLKRPSPWFSAHSYFIFRVQKILVSGNVVYIWLFSAPSDWAKIGHKILIAEVQPPTSILITTVVPVIDIHHLAVLVPHIGLGVISGEIYCLPPLIGELEDVQNWHFQVVKTANAAKYKLTAWRLNPSLGCTTTMYTICENSDAFTSCYSSLKTWSSLGFTPRKTNICPEKWCFFNYFHFESWSPS